MSTEPPSRVRFFMAEDNPGDVTLMLEAIKEVGLAADVEVATDGAEAVTRLLDPEHRPPDLIILNFNLPKLQGHGVLAAIKRTERLLGVPVVMLTTSNAQADRLLCESADAYFIKSGDWDELLRIVRHFRDLMSSLASKRPATATDLANDPFWKQTPPPTMTAPAALADHGPRPHAPLKIVCLGSSAGGLAPTVEFFKQMSPTSGMAFVVIQHLKADTPSLTPDILSRITRMRVSSATDDERALPNHVYTIAPNARLTIADGRFQVAARSDEPSRHRPFDRFLKSLAINSGEQATAVVLSGYDGDGSEGLVAIKAGGGSTYAQDRSAEIDEMPQHALETGCVDHVLSPGRIAERISLRR